MENSNYARNRTHLARASRGWLGGWGQVCKNLENEVISAVGPPPLGNTSVESERARLNFWENFLSTASHDEFPRAANCVTTFTHWFYTLQSSCSWFLFGKYYTPPIQFVLLWVAVSIFFCQLCPSRVLSNGSNDLIKAVSLSTELIFYLHEAKICTKKTYIFFKFNILKYSF